MHGAGLGYAALGGFDQAAAGVLAPMMTGRTDADRAMDIEVRLVAATRADAAVVERLLQLYEYDYSGYAERAVDVDERGVFPTVDTEAIWRPGYHVFLIEVDGKVAGFAFATREASLLGDGEVWVVGEFFVLRRYRRRGVGEWAARSLFERFPGRWEVSELRENAPAQAFWRRVIGRYTGGDYREVELDDERWRGPVQVFESPAAAGHAIEGAASATLREG